MFANRTGLTCCAPPYFLQVSCLSCQDCLARMLRKITKYLGKHNSDAAYKVPYLACHGCMLAARELRLSLSSKVKRKYKGDPIRAQMKKEVAVKQGIHAACERKRW